MDLMLKLMTTLQTIQLLKDTDQKMSKILSLEALATQVANSLRAKVTFIAIFEMIAFDEEREFEVIGGAVN